MQLTDINYAIFKENLLQLMAKKNTAYLKCPNKCYLINGNIFYENVPYENMSTQYRKAFLNKMCFTNHCHI